MDLLIDHFHGHYSPRRKHKVCLSVLTFFTRVFGFLVVSNGGRLDLHFFPINFQFAEIGGTSETSSEVENLKV